MKELIEFMARSLVEHPDQVQVRERRSANAIVLRLSVAEEDMGRIIGKNGRVANTMRALLRVAGVREGKKVVLEIN